ncbi:MAG: pentapeptide repeat-containing protein [Deltaproteobacteria bacterium]|nr:pentapeptide repeat-containing protein [Deltaproteobacteria bacterium]
MQIINETPFAAALLEGPNPLGGGLTVVVKGAFDVVAGARATARPRRPPTEGALETFPRELGGELAWETGPHDTCRYPSDFAPFKPATDVMAVATLSERDTDTRRVQLRAGGLTKIIELRRGSRRQLLSLAPLGGPTAERLAASGTYDARWRATRWPWFPEDFDWSTFQAAPSDQRVAGYLNGDELLQLDGNTERDVKTYLPSLRPRAFVRGARGRTGTDSRIHEIALVLDTVWLDADVGAFVLVWRGHLAGLRADDTTAALVAVEALDENPAPRRTFEAEERWRSSRPTDREAAEGDHEDDEGSTIEMPPKEPAFAQETDEAQEIANAVAMLREARLPEELVAKAAHAPTLASLGALLEAELPAFEAKAVDEASSLERAKELLRSHGHDPGLLDEPPMPSEPDEGAPNKLTRDDVLARVKAGESLSGADLRGLDLSRAALQSAKLDGANLDGANLDGADLCDADLADATLRNASAEGARFDHVTAERAGLESLAAKRASFVGANLAGAKLSYGLLTGADFTRADLTRANLAGALLAEATLVEADLDAAELQLAVLCEAQATRSSMRNTDMTGVNLTGATLDGASLTGATLDRVKLDAASLVDARLEGAHGEHVSFEHATMTRLRAGRGCSFPGANLRDVRGNDANFSAAELTGATLDGATLERALFRGTRLEGASLHLAVLRQIDFSDAVLARARLTKVNAFQARFPNADLGDADCRASNFFQSEFWQANTRGTRFDKSLLTGTKLDPEGMT